MAALLIDVGALALFLGYVATVYWYAVSPPRTRQLDLSRAPDASHRSDVAGVMREPRSPLS